MGTLSIRITHRAAQDCNPAETTVEVNPSQAPTPILLESEFVAGELSETTDALASLSSELGCANTLDDILHAIDALRASPKFDPNAPLCTRAIKVLANGDRIGPTNDAFDSTIDHVAVIDPLTDLMYYVNSVGDENGETIAHGKCEAACGKVRALGRVWRHATRAEGALIIDDTRTDPAVDRNLFPGIKPNWHWLSTGYAGSSASAWLVDFYGGSVSYYPRSLDGFALAVCRAGQ